MKAPSLRTGSVPVFCYFLAWLYVFPGIVRGEDDIFLEEFPSETLIPFFHKQKQIDLDFLRDADPLLQLIRSPRFVFVFPSHKPLSDKEMTAMRAEFDQKYKAFWLKADTQPFSALDLFLDIARNVFPYLISDDVRAAQWKAIDWEVWQLFGKLWDKKKHQWNSILTAHMELESKLIGEPSDWIKILETLEELLSGWSVLVQVEPWLLFPISEDEKIFLHKHQSHIKQKMDQTELRISFLLRHPIWPQDDDWTPNLFVPRHCHLHFTQRRVSSMVFIYRYVSYLVHCPDGHAALKKAMQRIRLESYRSLLKTADPKYHHRIRQEQQKVEHALKYGYELGKEDMVMLTDVGDLPSSDAVAILQKGAKQFLKHMLRSAFSHTKRSINQWDPSDDLYDGAFWMLISLLGVGAYYVSTTDIKFIRSALQSASFSVAFDLACAKQWIQAIFPSISTSRLKKWTVHIRLEGFDLKSDNQFRGEVSVRLRFTKDMSVEVFSQWGNSETENSNDDALQDKPIVVGVIFSVNF